MSETLPGHVLPNAFTPALQQPVSTDTAPYGGILLKRHVLPAEGLYVAQHAHAYDHITVVAAGGLRAWCDGRLLGDFLAPAELPIPAGSMHAFMALAAETLVYCVHAAATYAETERAELPGLVHDCAACPGCFTAEPA